MSRINVSVPHFEGPLDLLLKLIERRELDVTRLSLAAVTDEFLATIRGMEVADPDQIADFLVIAARLLLIKSRSLLPVPPEEESPEQDSGEELARMLETYRRFKEVAAALGEREAEGLRAYTRDAPLPDLKPRLDPDGMSVGALFGALQELLLEVPPEPESVDAVVQPIRVTVRQRITDLTGQLRRGKRLSFRSLLTPAAGRQEVIASFLALLELLKLGWCRVEQGALWGEIDLIPLPQAIPDEETADAAHEIDEYV